MPPVTRNGARRGGRGRGGRGGNINNQPQIPQVPAVPAPIGAAQAAVVQQAMVVPPPAVPVYGSTECRPGWRVFSSYEHTFNFKALHISYKLR